MNSSLKRISIATVVTIFGCLLTYLWHLKTEPKKVLDSESITIAYIAKSKHEVQKKGVNNTLWEPAEAQDILRVGDSIRTSTDSETRINFYRSNRYIDLESDSMIIIQKQDDEINLDLLEGSLFVSGVDKASKDTLTLKSNGGKIDLSKTAAQISGSSNSKMDLKILKGTAQYLKNNGSPQTISEGKEGGLSNSGLRLTDEKIKIQSPDITKPVYINASAPEPILVQWSGFPPKSQIILESGSNRKKLIPINVDKFSKNQILVPWKSGIYYWKLKAIDPDTQQKISESPIYKLEVVGRFPPTPINPEPNFVIQTRKQSEKITLRWATQKEYSQILVELKNENTKQIILSKQFSNSHDSVEVSNLGLGQYSWQLTAFPEDGSKPLIGPSHIFSINEKRIIRVPIIWSSNIQLTQYYANSDPTLHFSWEPDDSDRVKKWKVHISPEGTPFEKGEFFDTRLLKFEKNLSKGGRFSVYVEAFDEENYQIGASSIQVFNVTVLPLLASPTWLQSDQSIFLGRPDGSFPLVWNNLEGAKSFQILVRDETGNVINEFTSESPNYKINNLMPGNYSIQIVATDNFNRQGNISEKRTLTVPNKSEVKAPRLRKIKVN